MGFMMIMLLIGQEDIKSKVYDLNNQINQLSNDNTKLLAENETLKTENNELSEVNEKLENSLINYKMNVGPGIYNVTESGDFVPGTYQINVISGNGKISGSLGTYPYTTGEEDMMSFMLEDQVIVSGDLQLEVILKLKNDSGVKASDFKNN